MTRRLAIRRRGSANAYGAVAAQFSQAIGSFLLHVQAKSYLGLEGLANYALLFGIIVVATAVSTGLVGDSLTVLERGAPSVRAALQRWLGLVAAAVAIVSMGGAALVGYLTLTDSILFGVTSGIFVAEDALRRLLMASLRFWSLVAVDTCALLASVGTVFAVHEFGADVSLTTFLLALGLGQVLAAIVAVNVLPLQERWLARGARREMAAVWEYGAWRALQQLLRPGTLTLVRIAIIAIVSAAAYGQLELARLYVAPLMLMVSGGASYLFASYARDRRTPLSRLRRRADRTVVLLMSVSCVAGLVATILAPHVAGLITSDDEEIRRLAVLGWTAYAAAVAAVTPYGSLAAVRGRQGAVFAVRVGESVVSIVAVVALLLIDLPVATAPLAMAVVAALSGAVMRRWLLRVPAAASAGAALEDDGAERLEHDPDVVQ